MDINPNKHTHLNLNNNTNSDNSSKDNTIDTVASTVKKRSASSKFRVKKVKNHVILANLNLRGGNGGGMKHACITDKRYKSDLLEEYLAENDHFEAIARKLRKHKNESKWKKNEISHKQDWCKEQMKLIRLEKEQIKYYKSLKKNNIMYDIIYNSNGLNNENSANNNNGNSNNNKSNQSKGNKRVNSLQDKENER